MSAGGQGRRLLVFGRAPVPGRVKTRLIPGLGEAGAATVYQRLLLHALNSCADMHGVSSELWLDQPADAPALLDTAGCLGLTIHQQCGTDLGARMHDALSRALVDADSVVLIGSDCPEYDPPYVEAAFEALEQHDVVLGPAADGGYLLIGLTHAEPALFERIPWGTPQVLDATRARLRHLHLDWLELATKRDVDRPEDLADFPHLTEGLGDAVG